MKSTGHGINHGIREACNINPNPRHIVGGVTHCQLCAFKGTFAGTKIRGVHLLLISNFEGLWVCAFAGMSRILPA